MLKNRLSAPGAALVQHSVLSCAHTRAALVRIRPLRRHVMLHGTTSGWIMNDAMLVCTCRISARAYASGTLRRHAMLHIIHYPAHITLAYRHKPLMPLLFDWLLSCSRCKPVVHFHVNVTVGRPILVTGADRNCLPQHWSLPTNDSSR